MKKKSLFRLQIVSSESFIPEFKKYAGKVVYVTQNKRSKHILHIIKMRRKLQNIHEQTWGLLHNH